MVGNGAALLYVQETEVTSILLGTRKAREQLQYPRGTAWPLFSRFAKGSVGESGESIVW